MRPQVLLAVLVVVAVLAAALPLAHSQGAMPSMWPCCDKCGSCTRSIPPQCTCMDVSPTRCNKACKTCVKSTGGFRCTDRIVNFCERRCTPAALLSDGGSCPVVVGRMSLCLQFSLTLLSEFPLHLGLLIFSYYSPMK
ncbi:Bowman-Birk type proteinase inhibitor 2-like [Triticum dicoccoides]|uniref:Bowman-Birk type proteinase inhibitor 2-like n=1 Tax=Triticum dicoccoides TaxID=85692 RepID=UPI00189058A8|nr:Bowman-Birk type proteinase inhibitor 2-like [Triticum dicoccoides]